MVARNHGFDGLKTLDKQALSLCRLLTQLNDLLSHLHEKAPRIRDTDAVAPMDFAKLGKHFIRWVELFTFLNAFLK
jgi:hypothetical protein